MQQTWIVIGSEGYIGTEITKVMRGSCYVVGLDIKPLSSICNEYYSVDICNHTEVSQCIENVLGTTQTISGVVFCVGEIGEGTLQDISIDKFRSHLEVNLISNLYIAQLVLKHFLNNGGGKFIFISSIFGTVVGPSILPYNISKSALLALSKSIAEDYSAKGVQSNVISPSFLESPFVNKISSNVMNNKKWMYLNLLNTPQKISLSSISDTVLFLAKQDNSMNGTNIIIDAGYTIH